MEICGNAKCRDKAVAAIVQSISEKTMTVYPIDRIKAGNIVYLCAKHAIATKPMRGWNLINNFPELEGMAANTSSMSMATSHNSKISKKDQDSGVIHTSFTKKQSNGKPVIKSESPQIGKSFNLPPRPIIPDDDMTVLMREVTHNDLNLANGKKAEIPAHLKGMQKGPFTAVRSGQTEMLTILGFPKDAEKPEE